MSILSPSPSPRRRPGLQVGLLAWGRTREEDFNNFHDFEHTPGLVLLALRLMLCALS